jgi:hypothetical protein
MPKILVICGVLFGLSSVTVAPGFAASNYAAGSANFVANGDLKEGEGNAPSHWDPAEVGKSDTLNSRLIWEHARGSQPELQIANAKPAGAGWEHLLTLGPPGWYFLSADIRTVGVTKWGGGAQVGLTEPTRTFMVTTASLHGTNTWRTAGFYFKVNTWSKPLVLMCRLGTTDQSALGQASFRDFSIVRTSQAPPVTAPQYDIDELEAQLLLRHPTSFASPSDTLWSLLAVYFSLAAVAAAGWKALG